MCFINNFYEKLFMMWQYDVGCRSSTIFISGRSKVPGSIAITILETSACFSQLF
jgi:hypothetical protein